MGRSGVIGTSTAKTGRGAISQTCRGRVRSIYSDGKCRRRAARRGQQPLPYRWPWHCRRGCSTDDARGGVAEGDGRRSFSGPRKSRTHTIREWRSASAGRDVSGIGTPQYRPRFRAIDQTRRGPGFVGPTQRSPAMFRVAVALPPSCRRYGVLPLPSACRISLMIPVVCSGSGRPEGGLTL